MSPDSALAGAVPRRVSDGSYALGKSPAETRRLILQGKLNEAHTRNLLVMSGLTRGQRVLDIGCGAGDVTMLAADIVGPTGSVVGVDEDADILRVAKQRTEQAGLANVSFRQGTLPDVAVDEPVDALVGRLVLVHLPDPAAALRALVERVRPGGLVSMIEFRTASTRAVPEVPLVTRCVEWCYAGFRAAGVDPDTGERLPRILRDAGLRLQGISVAGTAGHADSAVVRYLAMTVESLLPVIEAHDIADRREIGLATLEQRLRDEMRAENAVLYAPELICAWANVDADH
ncbi:class I SAM-dependent methyltransferase [Kutzneria sp. NPDC051319]|uniref:class I SAM-dependent methyltransferase n=1 Tax=Kutzneria sp. NPDC051319 TaxID=3155047 RepID=UPI0034389E46